MIDENKLKQKLVDLINFPIIDIVNCSLNKNGEYLVTFIYNDTKYNQIITANLTLPERIFDNL